ncbi:hypothetical protein ACAX43_26595 [Paraburkholderia sp. IW21]|uniref:hypothetical protein n=1 Tax=Paraburkholderia sp. IW21 TaxID=3242488 RepID=UPI003521B9E9
MTKVLKETVEFADEGHLQDVLAGVGVGAQGTRDNLSRLVETGASVTVTVPGMPRRAVMQRSKVEPATKGTPAGSDLVLVPFEP